MDAEGFRSPSLPSETHSCRTCAQVQIHIAPIPAATVMLSQYNVM